MSHTPKLKKLHRKSQETRVATWNLNGRLREGYWQEEIIKDMREHRVEVAALQETMWNEDTVVKGDIGEEIINFQTHAQGYRGLGFFMTKLWRERLISTRIINERIAVIRFRMLHEEKGTADVVMINAYGPTMMKAKHQPELTEAFYQQLERTYRREKKGAAFTFILGDFNAKVGTDAIGDRKCMGRYGKGTRNENGDALLSFLTENNLYLANTHFKHRDRQIATWHKETQSRKQGRARGSGVHNQIDYIVAPRYMIQLFNDARAMGPTRHRSDHSLVIGTVTLRRLYKIKRLQKRTEARRDLRILTRAETAEAYKAEVSKRLKQHDGASTKSANEIYETVKRTLHQTAKETLPIAPRKVNGKIQYLGDEELNKLSKRQQRLSKQIYHCKGKINRSKKQGLKEKRKKVFKRIKERIRVLNEEKMMELAEEMENNKGNRRMYEVARIMSKSQSAGFSLYDADSGKIYETTRMMEEITRFYSSFFAREGTTKTEQWRGEPRKLIVEITGDEVTMAAKRLRNNRALGPDDIAGELIKYGGEDMHQELANAYNEMFKRHEAIEELTAGYLYALNKPGKIRTAENTRPLVFLSITRKVLSNIVLSRISGKANSFLSLSQHAYRSSRSTTEVAMTAQWLSATSERYAEKIHIMGIDLSKAFDCVDRIILMNTLEEHEIATEDELRILQYLVSETTLQVKIGETYGTRFNTIIGVPQGDALSPLLFLIYLEKIIRTAKLEEKLRLHDIMHSYADDINFAMIDTDGTRRDKSQECENAEECTCAQCRARRLERYLPQHFAKYYMQMNIGKTTHVEFDAGNSVETQLSTVGNRVSGKQECNVRIQSANAAFNSMNRIWLRKTNISTETKMRLYNSCVQSRLLYNAGASVYRKTELDKIDAVHRRHLRRLLGVFYPEHLSNMETYERTKSRPISIDIIERRWTLLGHTLRLPKDTPGNKVISQYYQRRVEGANAWRQLTRRGRVLTTLPRLLQRDLKDQLTIHERKVHFNVDELENGRQLEILRMTARSRHKWRDGVVTIVEKAHKRWTHRNAMVSRKRAAEKMAYENKKKGEENRSEARKKRQRTIDQYFR